MPKNRQYQTVLRSRWERSRFHVPAPGGVAMSQISWKGTWRGRSPDGLVHEPARNVVRRTGGIIRGKFPSRKTGRMVKYEGLLEWRAIYLFEASPAVVRYTDQPETTQYPDGNRLRRYTPDFEVCLRDGSSMLIEVKPKKNADKPDIRHMLDVAADFYARRGRTLHVLTDEYICVEPRLANLRWVYHRAPRIRPTDLKGALALRRMFDAFPMSIRDAATYLSPIGLDPYTLLMAGALVCDLTSPVSLDTRLHINLENYHEWFRISDRLGF